MGAHTITGGSNGSREGAEPPEPPHFNHCSKVAHLEALAEVCCVYC